MNGKADEKRGRKQGNLTLLGRVVAGYMILVSAAKHGFINPYQVWL